MLFLENILWPKMKKKSLSQFKIFTCRGKAPRTFKGFVFVCLALFLRHTPYSTGWLWTSHTKMARNSWLSDFHPPSPNTRITGMLCRHPGLYGTGNKAQSLMHAEQAVYQQLPLQVGECSCIKDPQYFLSNI